jgi:hypothetical protein
MLDSRSPQGMELGPSTSVSLGLNISNNCHRGAKAYSNVIDSVPEIDQSAGWGWVCRCRRKNLPNYSSDSGVDTKRVMIIV